MAGGAADALRHVDRVVEVDEVGEVVDAVPDERPPRPEALAHRLEHRGVFPDDLVAVVAGRRRGDAGEGRRLDAGVAVAAVDAEPGDVVVVAEGDELRRS